MQRLTRLLSTATVIAVVFCLLSCPPAKAQSQRFARLHRMMPQREDYTNALAVADFDSDGHVDCYVATSSGSDRLLRNIGAGVFVEATVASRLPTTSEWTHGVAVGDLDLDGDFDLIVVHGGRPPSANRVFHNDGVGRFYESSSALPPSVVESFAVVVGDANGDGFPDLFISTATGVRAYVNTSFGSFTEVTASSLPTFVGEARALALGDVDGDSDLDLWIGMSSAQNRLLLNDGLGGFTDVTSTHLPVLSEDTVDVELGDVDGDGDLDALVANRFSGSIRLHQNDGVGRFQDVTPAGMIGTQCLDAVLADVDGDSDLDAVLAGGGQNRLFRNSGGGFTDVTAATLPLRDDPTFDAALVDVDGDGDPDLLTGNDGWQDSLLLNDGRGVFTDVTAAAFPLSERHFADAALGDVDGDGDLDALVGNGGFSWEQNALYLNDGTGLFGEAGPSTLPQVQDITSSVELVDIDGDGDLDAFLGNAGFWGFGGAIVGVVNGLLRNDGNGSFVDIGGNLPGHREWTVDVALGDVDGDGDLDAWVANDVTNVPALSAQDRLLLNDSTGFFVDATATNIPVIGEAAVSVELGDVDDDGDLDALVGNYAVAGATGNRLYSNDGTGVFTDVTASSLPNDLRALGGLALGDVDGDGDLDAVFSSGTVGLYENTGGGVFVDRTAQRVQPVTGATDLHLVDVDLDGDLDCWVTAYPRSHLLVNNGRAFFLAAGPAWMGDGAADGVGLAVGDVDGDGDADVLFGRDPPELLINLSRQLGWRGPPRVGKQLVLDVYGSTGASWFVGASLSTSSVPLPFGLLRLDPRWLTVMAGGALPWSGQAAFETTVPSGPSLIGVTLYWQGLLDAPLTLTNLEMTTFSGL